MDVVVRDAFDDIVARDSVRIEGDVHHSGRVIDFFQTDRKGLFSQLLEDFLCQCILSDRTDGDAVKAELPAVIGEVGFFGRAVQNQHVSNQADCG